MRLGAVSQSPRPPYRRSMRPVVTIVLLLLLGSASASAASPLAAEQRDGRTIAGQVRSGATTCDELTGEDLDHVGEYVMGRMLGATSTHGAMNDRMTAMLGTAGEERMHQAMGARYLDCTTGAAAGIGAVAPIMGGGMMGRGAMMGGDGYGWMADGSWRHMSRTQWQHMMSSWSGHHDTHHTWGALAIILLISGAVGLVVAGLLALQRRRMQGGPSGTPA